MGSVNEAAELRRYEYEHADQMSAEMLLGGLQWTFDERRGGVRG